MRMATVQQQSFSVAISALGSPSSNSITITLVHRFSRKGFRCTILLSIYFFLLVVVVGGWLVFLGTHLTERVAVTVFPVPAGSVCVCVCGSVIYYAWDR